MFDIHLPARKIEGLKEFLLHIFTITIGLLIAVGIERFVDWRHHENLLAEARATLHEEIVRNAGTLDGAIKSLEAAQQTMQRNLEIVSRLQKGMPEPGKDSLDGTTSTVSLRETSWKTAQASGAVVYMPYAEAQTYQAIYDGQEAFERKEDLLMQDSAAFFGLIRKFSLGRGSDLTAVQADEVAERLGIWQGHLLLLHGYAKGVGELQHAFLEGREPGLSTFESMPSAAAAAPQ
jgi:hypothetical protein